LGEAVAVARLAVVARAVHLAHYERIGDSEVVEAALVPSS